MASEYGANARPARTMKVQPYDTCKDCGQPLAESTVYRNHAYCSDCKPLSLN
ncbi:MAG: hypothetical protein V5A37_07185 [Halobacteriales archaeon]